MKVKDHFLSQEQFSLIESTTRGILKTDPVPQNIDKYYESKNYISHHQDQGGLREKIYKFLQNFNLNYKKNIILSLVEKGSLVLDYGCGAGEFVKYIENDFATIGYEPNAAARTAAEKKTRKSLIVDNITTIQDSALDGITLWHVFEHIENQQDTLNIFYDKLKNNGLLIIAVPNFNSYDATYYQEHWAAYDVPRHLYHYSREGMENFFKNSNWKLLEIKPLLLDSYYISILSEKYRKNPFFWFKGPIVGAISNIKAAKTGEFSSLIYILKKK